MKKSQLWTTAIAATAFAGAGALLGTSAQAAGTLTVGPGSITATLDPNESVYFCSTSSCTQQASLYVASSGTYTSGSSVLFGTGSGQSGFTQLPAGIYTVAIFDVSTFVTSQSNVVIGDGGGTSSDAAPSTPVEASLSLDLAASGASCTSGSAATGVVGTWLSLPGADDCTSTTTPNAKLLGWATKADFPVEIAQRQIDNGWGAYELFNDEGQMTAVFIPAGGATFVSASTSLHPIWAS